MTIIRGVEEWIGIFARQTDGSPRAIANRILGDIWGYDTHTKDQRYRKQDDEMLANALLAFSAIQGEKADG